jgi:hypothetical protein
MWLTAKSIGKKLMNSSRHMKLSPSFANYKFLCGFDCFTNAEVIMPHQVVCHEGHHVIVRNDVCLMVTNKVDGDGTLRVHEFFHLLSYRASLEGYTLKVRGVVAYYNDELYTHTRLNNYKFMKKNYDFSFVQKRCDSPLVDKLNSLLTVFN